MPRSRRHFWMRRLAVVLLLCAVAVRLVVPQGYMWSTAANGSPQMVICPGMTPPLHALSHTMSHDMMTGDDHRRHDGKTADHPCAFAAASAAVDLAPASHPVAPPVAAAYRTPAFYRFVRPGLGLAAPPPPKTGPPAFA